MIEPSKVLKLFILSFLLKAFIIITIMTFKKENFVSTQPFFFGAEFCIYATLLFLGWYKIH